MRLIFLISFFFISLQAQSQNDTLYVMYASSGNAYKIVKNGDRYYDKNGDEVVLTDEVLVKFEPIQHINIPSDKITLLSVNNDVYRFKVKSNIFKTCETISKTKGVKWCQLNVKVRVVLN